MEKNGSFPEYANMQIIFHRPTEDLHGYSEGAEGTVAKAENSLV